jgi:predicted O-linked N-acetylglucosamine transferase (SPINDLY family)
METGPFPHAVLVDDPLEQLKVARHYALHVQRGVRPLPRRTARENGQGRGQGQGGRLRIGYLSADFHLHATSQLMVQMLEHHDRSEFEVTLFSTGPDDGSATRERIKASSEHFEELRGCSVERMAQRVRELGIDILVDLKGATYDTLLPVLAQRPAPLQVTWLGFPGSSGAPFIDYLIGDEIVSPLADAANFSEQIAQLPGCYQPNDSLRALPLPSTRADWGVPDGALLLCGFHQSYKISAEVFGAWCDLLHALPGAVLWLLQWNTNVQTRLTAAARERGIGPERLAFAPLLPLQEHLSRLACADIYLDAWPCNAHTTAGEALWVGVPVITVRGRTFAQRVAASLLHSVALDELVCDDARGYVEKVVALAADAPRRAQLRAHIATQRSASTLFDGASFARDIEALYQRMWARAAAGLPPTHLPPERSAERPAE